MKRIFGFSLIFLLVFFGQFWAFSSASGAWGGELYTLCRITPQEREVLWLARAVFSETKDPAEMELIGWVLRNRVKTQYLGDTTYEAVARRKHQFSGLNPYDKQYHTNVTMSYHDRNTAWQNALKVASEVYAAPEADRPFPGDVKHFYSPQSVARVPDWAREGVLHTEVKSTDGGVARFAFYSGVR